MLFIIHFRLFSVIPKLFYLLSLLTFNFLLYKSFQFTYSFKGLYCYLLTLLLFGPITLFFRLDFHAACFLIRAKYSVIPFLALPENTEARLY